MNNRRTIVALLATIAALLALNLLAANEPIAVAQASGAIGACCLPDFGFPCEEMSEEDCIAQGGMYQGDETECANVDCEEFGACCFADASCDIGFRSSCEAVEGAFQGAGLACDDKRVICTPYGACCRPDGTCYHNTGQSCEGEGHVYSGDGITCLQVECEAPGACCIPADGTCLPLIEEACADLGGVWAGKGSDCSRDENFNGIPDACETCRSDSNADGVVDFVDLLTLLSDWGPCE